MISFPVFVQQNPVGKTVSTPVNTYSGECVSLIRQILLQVHGVDFGAIGHAVAYANTANQARLATLGFVWKADTNFQDGDILVWGDDAGSWTGVYGHISSFYQGKLYNQNYGGNGKISFNNFFPQGYLGRYTKGDDMTTRETLEKIWAGFLDRPPMDSEYKEFVGRPLESILHTAWASPEFKTRMDGMRKMFFENLDLKNEVVTLRKQLSDGTGEFEQVVVYRKVK